MFIKVINITLIFTLFLATTGFSVSKHYCGDRLVSVSVNTDTKPCCDMNNGCCKNETEHLQLKDNFVTPIISDNIQIVEIDFLSSIIFSSIGDKLDINVLLINNISDLSSLTDLQTELAKRQTYLL